MAPTNDLLRHRDFWFYYQFGSERPLDPKLAEEYSAPKAGTNRPSIEFTLQAGDRFSLEIGVSPKDGCLELGLRDGRDGRAHQLGWWDDARCHPFALRWSELQILLSRLAKGSPDRDFSLLLLARWVGIPPAETATLEAGRRQIGEIYKKLDCYSDSEVRELTPATLMHPSEDDYRWTKDARLGWVFGGEYPCYSLRNPGHADGREGAFPFELFRTFMGSLGDSTV